MTLDPILNDRLANSFVHIREIVESTVNFQGRLEHVVIDELQFALNLCGVTIWWDGRELASNLDPSESGFLHAHFEQSSISKTAFGDIRITKSENSPLKEAPEMMRADPRSATCRYSAESGRGRIDLYYNPSRLIAGVCEYLDLNSPNHSRLLSLIAESFTMIGPRIHTGANAEDAALQLLSQVESSDYLKLLLGNLKSSVLEHLQERHPAFAGRSEFLIQYFFTYRDDQMRKVLRYFPIDEIAQLSDHQNVRELARRLRDQGDPLPKDVSPQEFISKYDWVSEDSFVGYVLNTRCALYLENWTNEPRVKARAIGNGEQHRNRRIATTVMQYFRKDPPDQFIVPFFYRGIVIGLMLVNCPESIRATDRRELIRAARNIAPQIFMAVDSDKEVNHVVQERRKAAEVRAYKYIVNAVMHEDARFCRQILKHFAEHPPRDRTAKQLLFMTSEKRQAVEEYQTSYSPLRHVEDASLYPSKNGQSVMTDVPIEALAIFKSEIDSIYNPTARIQFDLEKGPNLIERGAIPDFERYIVARVMINLAKNALTAAKKNRIPKERARMRLTIDLVANSDGDFLQIVAIDNCGGFLKEQLAAWNGLTLDRYIEYLNRKDEEENTTSHTRVTLSSGMGILIILKYVSSTGGVFQAENCSDPDTGSDGAKVTVRLKLRSS